MCSRFHLLRESARGFSLIELMIVVGFATVMMAISVPILTDISQTTKLNDAGTERRAGAPERAAARREPESSA